MARLTLNDHLFEVMENLTDKNLKGDELKEYMQRAEVAAKVAQQIVANQNFMLKAINTAIDNGFVNEAKSKLKLLTE
jgi:hypothetical protein